MVFLQAYVLYLFLALMLAYVGNDDENQLMNYLENMETQAPPFPFNCCCFSPIPKGIKFLRLAFTYYWVNKIITLF